MAENSTLARPYAQAVFDLARAKDALAQWSEVLATLAEIACHPDVRAMVRNPAIDDSVASGIISDLCGDLLTDEVRRLIDLMLENGRFTVLPDIHEQFETLRSEFEKRARVEVVSAYELNAKQKNSITSAMKKRLGHDVELTTRTDKSLLGGAIVRVDDLVIDDSVMTQLGRLKAALSR